MGRRQAAAAAQGLGQRRAVVAAALGKALGALAAPQGGEDGQAEDGGEGMAPAVAAAGVGDIGEGIGEG